MSPLKEKFRKQITIRPRVLALCVIGLGCLLIAPVFGARQSTGAIQYVVYDDITNTVKATPETGTIPDTAPTTDNGNNGHGNNTDGVDSSNPGQGGSHDNNGHGNNTDGVDSSNPGQGQGGPNGGVDQSCDGTGDCIDDEAGTGGRGNNK